MRHVSDTDSGLVRQVGAGGVRLAYRTWGLAGAPPAVLLHALGEQSSDWTAVASALLIAGGPDSHIDQGQLAEMATLIPDCELITIPAGHLVHAVRTAEFTAAVNSFLRDR